MEFPGRRRALVKKKKKRLGDMPTDVLMNIMALLPVPQLFQLSSVSKSWKSMLDSPAFLEAWSAEAPSGEVWFVMAASGLPIMDSPEEALIAYSNSLGKWFRFPIFSPCISSSLGPRAYNRGLPLPMEFFGFPLRVAAAGGLVCSVVAGYPGPSVIVFNPLTGAARRLRRPPKRHRSFKDSEDIKVLMFANSAANSYHVVLMDNLDQSLAVFDSKSNSWKVGQDIACATFSGDVQTCDLWIYKRDMFYAYKIEMNTWTKVALQRPHGGDIIVSGPLAVMQYRGQILLVARSLQEDNFHLRIWELQVSSYGAPARWSQVVTRQAPYAAALSINYFECKEFGPLICTSLQIKERTGHYGPLLVYDVSHDSWYHLPHYNGTLNYTCLFLCQPSLVAVP